MHSVDKKIIELGLILPEIVNPIANYIPCKIIEKTLYISGQGPIKDGKVIYKGKLGKDLTLEEGISAAKICCLNIISIIKYACNGNWDNFGEIIKIGGFVNCENDFYDQPKVINGVSDMLVQIFEEKGKHSRFAIGTNTLPLNIAVEVEAIVALK